MADELKRARTQSKTKLTREIRKLSESIEDGHPSPEIKRRLDAVNDAADDVEEKHDLYVNALGDADTVDDDADAWIETEIACTRAVRKKTHQVLQELSSSSTPSKVKLKAMDYPVFSGRPRDFQEWKKEYLDVIKPRLVGASEAEMSMCLRNCLSQEVKKWEHYSPCGSKR